MWNTLEMEQYLELTADSAGAMNDSNGKYHAECYNDHWWLAPACRNDASKCIPLLTGGDGWGIKQFMLKAFFL
jgi:hypothetical protein